MLAIVNIYRDILLTSYSFKVKIKPKIKLDLG